MSKNYLHDICQSLLQEAREHPDIILVKTLRRGLKILIRKNTFNIDIAIGRKGICPSEEEWSIVLREFGFPVVPHREARSKGWIYLASLINQ